MNYNELHSQAMPEAKFKDNTQPAHQDQQSIIANWLDQQPKILNDEEGSKINYADAIIALRKKKFGA